MPKIWNSDKETLYFDRRPYTKGDKISEAVLDKMGEETVTEYEGKKLIITGKSTKELKAEAAEAVKKANAETAKIEAEKTKSHRDDLMAKAKELGLKPRHNAGIGKIQQMIDAHNEPDSEE